MRILPELQTRADVGELLRTIGFASTPGLLRIFRRGAGPDDPVFSVTTVWMLLAMIVAYAKRWIIRARAGQSRVCVWMGCWRSRLRWSSDSSSGRAYPDEAATNRSCRSCVTEWPLLLTTRDHKTCWQSFLCARHDHCDEEFHATARSPTWPVGSARRSQSSCERDGPILRLAELPEHDRSRC